MMKTESGAARLALVERQRRYAWELAREEYARSAGRLVAGKTHDLLSLVQIVQLAAPVLSERCDAEMQVFVDDIARVANDAHAQLDALMAVARLRRGATATDGSPVRGAPVGPVVGRAVGELSAAVAIGVDYAIDVDAATALDESAISHLAIGLVLDVADAPWIELTVRDRAIHGAPWIEIVRGTAEEVVGDRFDLKLVEALVARAGGELTHIELGGGGLEVVVALPVVG